MQKIRDYVASTMKNGRYYVTLYTLRLHKHQWKHMESGSVEEMESRIRSMIGGDIVAFHLAGGIFTGLQDIVAEAPPTKVYDIATDIRRAISFNDEIPSAIYSTWGVIDDSELNLPNPDPPTWRFLGNGLPPISILDSLKSTAKYNRVRVCRYDPKLHCLESCEMRLWGSDGVKLV